MVIFVVNNNILIVQFNRDVNSSSKSTRYECGTNEINQSVKNIKLFKYFT